MWHFSRGLFFWIAYLTSAKRYQRQRRLWKKVRSLLISQNSPTKRRAYIFVGFNPPPSIPPLRQANSQSCRACWDRGGPTRRTLGPSTFISSRCAPLLVQLVGGWRDSIWISVERKTFFVGQFLTPFLKWHSSLKTSCTYIVKILNTFRKTLKAGLFNLQCKCSATFCPFVETWKCLWKRAHKYRLNRPQNIFECHLHRLLIVALSRPV